MLGVDAHQSEYWLFKDDCQRLFVKNIAKEGATPAWFFLDDEDDFDQVCGSLNSRGVREKRLLESLRKVKPSLRLRRAKASK